MSTSPSPSFVDDVVGEMKLGAEPPHVDSYPDRQPSWATSAVLGGAGSHELDANETPVVSETNGEDLPETLLVESETNGEEAAATPVVAPETPSVETATEALVPAVRGPSRQKSHGKEATGASNAPKNSDATGALDLRGSEADSEDGKSTSLSMLEGFLSSPLSSQRSSLSSADQSEWGGGHSVSGADQSKWRSGDTVRHSTLHKVRLANRAFAGHHEDQSYRECAC
jgi:hypothetical protein